jgi:hypothetical protein
MNSKYKIIMVSFIWLFCGTYVISAEPPTSDTQVQVVETIVQSQDTSKDVEIPKTHAKKVGAKRNITAVDRGHSSRGTEQLVTKKDLAKLCKLIKELGEEMVASKSELLTLIVNLVEQGIVNITETAKNLLSKFEGFVVIKLPNGDNILTTSAKLKEVPKLQNVEQNTNQES